MKKGILICLICLPILVKSQSSTFEVGLINDPDGYTLVRQSTSTISPINDTIFKGELFYFTPNDTSNWYQVRKFEHKKIESDSIDWLKLYEKWDLPGFVHKSRIKNIKSLNKQIQASLIDSMLNIEIRIQNQDINWDKVFENKNFHLVEIYHPVLNLFIQYMCQYNDEKILDLYFDFLILLSGSADESKSVALGYVYLCKPKIVLEKIQKLDDDNLINELEFGFISATSGREEEIENYRELKREIEKLNTTNNR